jgi:hypothetical protein
MVSGNKSKQIIKYSFVVNKWFGSMLVYDSFNSCLMSVSDKCSQGSCKQVLPCGICLQRLILKWVVR